MDLQFEWDEVEAFIRQPDGSLFSWCERFHCYRHIIYGIVSFMMYSIFHIFSRAQSSSKLKFDVVYSAFHYSFLSVSY